MTTKRDDRITSTASRYNEDAKVSEKEKPEDRAIVVLKGTPIVFVPPDIKPRRED